MSAPLRISAVLFEGIGSDTTKTSGLGMYFGNLTTTQADSLPSGYEWWPALAQEVGSVSASVNPFTGDWSVSGPSVVLSASDRVAALLMTDAVSTGYELAADLTTSGTSATVNASGISTGDVIWVGDEAILVGAASGTSLTSLTRGLWGSPAQSHASGDGVYTLPPYWRSRKVSVVEVDVASGTVYTRWRGLVADIVMSGPTIEVRCEDLLGALAAATVNVEGTRISPGASEWRSGKLDVVNPFITTRTLSESALDTSSSRTLMFQIDEALVPFDGTRIGSSGVVLSARPATDPFGLAGDALTLLDSSAPDATGETPVEEMHEVVAWVRQEGTGASALGYTPISGSALLPFHPISVCLTLLTSTGRGDNGDYDILGESWSLGVDYLDWSAWETARDDDPELVIDRLILGWGGEEVNPFDVAREVLRPFGYYLAITDDGLLYPARLRMVTEADVDAEDNTVGLYPDGPLVLERTLSLSTAEVRVAVGRLPWADAQMLTVRDPTRSRRAGQLLDSRVHTLDLSVFDPARVAVDGRIDAVVSPFVGLLGMGLDAAPVLRGRVADHTRTSGLARMDLGALLRVDDLGGVVDPWLVLPDGTRAELDDSTRWIGILTERAWEPARGTYTIGVLLTNWRSGVAVKERAPAGVVASVSSAIITLDDTGPYGDEPARAFAVGDEVRVVDANGVDAGTGTREITGLNDTKINVGTAFDTDPSAGDVIRLAQSGEFYNDSVYSGSARPWVYMAPDAATGVSDIDQDADAPDVYGTRLFGATGAVAPTASLVPIDDDAIEAADETQCEPLDAWLEYTLRDNVAELYQRGHQVTWSPVTANAGAYSTATDHRPYASVGQTSILYVPWLCEPGLAGITLGMISRVSSESDVAGDVTDATVTLALELGTRGTDTTVASTDGDSPEFQPTTIALDFSARPFGASGIEQLGVWLESGVSTGDAVLNGNATYGSTSIEIDSGTIYTDTTGTRPSATALDLQCTEDTDGGLYDHLQATSSTNMAVAAGGTSGGNTAISRWLSYLQVRSIEAQQVFRDTAYPSDESMRPRVPVLAETCVAHLAREDAHYRRARPLWVGPQGDRPFDAESNPEGWPSGYTERHIIHNADHEGGAPTRVLDASVWLDTTDPIVMVLLNVIPARLLDTAKIVRGRGGGVPGAEVNTTAQWDMWGVVEQLEDGDADWSEATTLGTTAGSKQVVRLTHWGATAQQAYPALHQHMLRRLDGWTYREGQLYRPDTALVQTIAVSVPVTYDPTTDKPARVVLHAEHQSVDWGYGSFRDVANLDMIVVGASIWEVPQ